MSDYKKFTTFLSESKEITDNDVDVNSLKKGYSAHYHSLDKYAVINTETNTIAQFDFDLHAANKSCDIFDEHEIRSGRKPIYKCLHTKYIPEEILRAKELRK